MRRELIQIVELTKTLEPDELCILIGDLAALSAMAQTRLSAPAASDEAMLDAETAADRLGIKRSTFYHRHKKYPFVHKEGSKLVADPKGLARYLAAKRQR